MASAYTNIAGYVAHLLKLDKNGNYLWQKLLYSNYTYESATSVVAANNSDILTAGIYSGHLFNTELNVSGFFVAQLNKDGAFCSGSSPAGTTSIVPVASGGFAVNQTNITSTVTVTPVTLPNSFTEVVSTQVCESLLANQKSNAINYSINNNTVAIYPNPVKNVLHVTLGGMHPSIAQLNIIDVNGKTVITEKLNATADKLINVSALKPGLYLLSIDADAKQQYLKFIKEDN